VSEVISKASRQRLTNGNKSKDKRFVARGTISCDTRLCATRRVRVDLIIFDKVYITHFGFMTKYRVAYF